MINRKDYYFMFYSTDDKDSGAIENYDEDDSNEQEVVEDTLDKEKYSSIVSSPYDWTVGVLLEQIKKGNIKLNPSYQRKNAWNDTKKSKFIESLILNIPVPNMLFAEEIGKRGIFNVLDGKQRLLSILEFYNYQIPGSGTKKRLKLKNLTILSELNGKTLNNMEDLYPEYVTMLENYSIRSTILRNIPSVEYLYEIFARINSGSEKLSPQELRQSRYPGPFLSFLFEKALQKNSFRLLFKLNDEDNRMRDIELMLRCYSFKYCLSDYPNSLSRFLDNSTGYLNYKWESSKFVLISDYEDFNKAIDLIYDYMDTDAFTLYGLDRKNKAFNRSVFDMFMFYFSNPKTRETLNNLFSNDKRVFKQSYYHFISESKEIQSAITINSHQTTNVFMKMFMFGEFLVALDVIPIEDLELIFSNLVLGELNRNE